MKRIAILGNHLPRQCGIATFTSHLADALATPRPDVDAFNLYYAAADASVALATGSVASAGLMARSA